MKPSQSIFRGIRIAPWCVCIATGLALLVGPRARAESDPVEAYQEALENHLDKKTRRETLQKLADRIQSLGDLSRAIRYRESVRLTDLKQDDVGEPKIRVIDQEIFLGLLRRFAAEFKKAVADPRQQQALATLAGNLATRGGDQASGMPVEYRPHVNRVVQEVLLPELDRMALSPNKEVQLAAVRAISQIILDLKENLLISSRESIRSTIGKIMEKSDPEVYSSIIEGADNLVKLYVPAPGEEPVVPKLVESAELIDLLGLVPIYSRGLTEPNAAIRKRSVAALARFTLLMVQNLSVVLELPLPPIKPAKPAADAKPEDLEHHKKQDEEYQMDRKIYLRQMQQYKQGFAALRALAEPLRKVIADPDPEVAARALRAVEDLAAVQSHIRKRKFTLPQAEDAEEKKPDEKKQAAPAETEPFLEPALEKLLPAIIEGLSAENPAVRLGAVQILERREPVPRAAAGALLERLGDSSAFVRWAAVRVLGRFKGQKVEGLVDGLGKLLRDHDLSVKLAVASTLGSLGREAKDATDALIDASTQGDPEIREAVLRALGAVGPGAGPEQRKEAVRMLAKQLSDLDYRVRRSSASALGRFGPADIADAEAALKQALKDEDGEVRRYAAEALLNK